MHKVPPSDFHTKFTLVHAIVATSRFDNINRRFKGAIHYWQQNWIQLPLHFTKRMYLYAVGR